MSSFPHSIYMLIILLFIGFALIVIGLTDKSRISAGPIRLDTGDISQGSRSRFLAFGVIWIGGVLVGFALYPHSPIYLGPNPGAVASSAPSGSIRSSSSASPADAEPVTVVKEYFAAINNHDYVKAWNIGGRYSGAASYTAFEAEFRGTAHDDVTILSLSGNIVEAKLSAQQTNGSVKIFEGYYTVEDGAITHFDVWHSG